MNNKNILLIGAISFLALTGVKADDNKDNNNSRKTCIVTASKAIAKDQKESGPGEPGVLELEFAHPNVACADSKGAVDVISLGEFLDKFKAGQQEATLITYNIGKAVGHFTSVTTTNPKMHKHGKVTFTATEMEAPKVADHLQHHVYREVKTLKMNKPTLVFLNMDVQ